jgi:hypothetical protein
VTALSRALSLALATLRSGVDRDWSVRAGPLEWSCWETAEHLADDLLTYATQLGAPSVDSHVPFGWTRRREGGPANAIWADDAAGVAGLLSVVEACGALLVSMERTVPATVRSYHIFGVSDPAGFAAMGAVETLVHTYDIAEGLGLSWTPPSDVCGEVLARLFTDAPGETDRWQTLLWATGRAELPGRARLTEWRWHGEPLPDA